MARADITTACSKSSIGFLDASFMYRFRREADSPSSCCSTVVNELTRLKFGARLIEPSSFCDNPVSIERDAAAAAAVVYRIRKALQQQRH